MLSRGSGSRIIVNIVQLTPGAGGMYCGNCFRDNALVASLRQQGHQVLMVPLYLPMTVDEADQTAGTPIFFSGINVYLEQQSAFFRRAPAWLHRLLAARFLLQWAAGRAAKTRPGDVGELTLSMLRGEQGNQAREVEDLVHWLKLHHRPEVVCLSNALLIGMARRLRAEVGAPVVCMLQGEDSFLDGLPEAQRAAAWRIVAERAADVALFVAPSQYFADRMRERLGLPAERVRVVPNGIDLAGYPKPPAAGVAAPASPAPVLGYFARMCRDKGLDTLVRAFIRLKQRGRVPKLKLRVGGGCGPTDEPVVAAMKQELAAAGALAVTEFHPNLTREEKIAFLRSLSVFSVPALYGEAFGLYVVEALAAGVPVVQPRVAAFPELVAATGGGKLCAPGDVESLADTLESLLLDLPGAAALGATGQRAVFARFSAAQMARNMAAAFAAEKS